MRTSIRRVELPDHWAASSFEWPADWSQELAEQREDSEIGNKSEWKFADKESVGSQVYEPVHSHSPMKIPKVLVKGTRDEYLNDQCVRSRLCFSTNYRKHGDCSANHLISANSTLRVVAVDEIRVDLTWIYRGSSAALRYSLKLRSPS